MTRGGSYLMAAPTGIGAAITIVLELFCPSIIYWLLLATSSTWRRATSGRWRAILTQCGER
jgi:hypothetical protein